MVNLPFSKHCYTEGTAENIRVTQDELLCLRLGANDMLNYMWEILQTQTVY